MLQCWCWYMCICCNWCVCCTFLKTVMVVAWFERVRRRRCCVMLQCWYMCDCCVCCATSLKKVMVAWCECIPRRCYVMLRLYVGICVTVSIVVYAVLHSWRRWWQPGVSAFLGGVGLNNPSACDATNTHSTHTTVQAFPFHGDHSCCGHCKCKIRWTNVSHILGTNYLQWWQNLDPFL